MKRKEIVANTGRVATKSFSMLKVNFKLPTCPEAASGLTVSLVRIASEHEFE